MNRMSLRIAAPDDQPFLVCFLQASRSLSSRFKSWIVFVATIAGRKSDFA